MIFTPRTHQTDSESERKESLYVAEAAETATKRDAGPRPSKPQALVFYLYQKHSLKDCPGNDLFIRD